MDAGPLCLFRLQGRDGGLDVAEHVERAVAEDDAVPARVLHRQLYAVRDRLAGRDGLAERGEVLCQILRVQRAGIARRDRDEFFGERRDVGIHAVEILVAEDAGEHREGPSGEIIVDVLDEGLDALRIVSAVDDEQRVFAPHVKPARPADGGKSFADVLVRKVPTALLHDGRRSERNGCIVQLMVAKQRQLQRVEALPVEDLAGQIVGEQMNIGKIRLVKRCTDLFAPRLDHGLDRYLTTRNFR